MTTNGWRGRNDNYIGLCSRFLDQRGLFCHNGKQNNAWSRADVGYFGLVCRTYNAANNSLFKNIIIYKLRYGYLVQSEQDKIITLQEGENVIVRNF